MGAEVTLTAFSLETHFLSHLAPVWRALPGSLRGRFLVTPDLIPQAAREGIDAEAIDADALRRSSLPPAARLAPGPVALVASVGDTKVARRLGFTRFIRLEHGAGQAYPNDRTGSYAGGPGNSDAALILCPNTYSAEHWRRAYPSAQVEVVGCTKLDSLPGREGEPAGVVAIAWHWPGPGWASTAWGEFRAALPALRERFTVIGHQHPNWLRPGMPQPPSRTYGKLGIPFVPDFEDVCRQADLYVTDNSSTLFEFAATGRPVVVLNSRLWSRKVSFGGRFWDWADVGVQVDAHPRPEVTEQRLLEGVARALRDAPGDAEARERTLTQVYGERRAGAALRASEAIVAFMDARVEVAA